MPQEYKKQEAIKMAIQAKKNLFDFYREAATITQNPKGKQVFELLAREVRENVSAFFLHYSLGDLGSFEEFMASPPKHDSAMLVELRKALDENTHERKARELAMREHLDMEQNFRHAADHMVDPMVRAVFNRVADETRSHYALIESEYARTMAMVHESDVDIYVRE
ncbi:MAG: ferritin-like domain-containing protein [Trichloromonadaceae bacterium]